MSRAVSSIAIWTMSMFRRQANDNHVTKTYQGLAIERVRRAIEDPTERKSYATILAALILQLQENLTAVHEQYTAKSTHHDGAVALITQDGLDAICTQHKRYLLSHILHTEVSSAIRGQRTVRMCLGCWDVVPENASTKLDLIGVSIANLRHHVTQLFSGDLQKNSNVPARPQMLEKTHSEAKRIYTDLIAWSRVPYHLGNRQTVAAISDLIDTSLSFPSFHDFNRSDPKLPEYIRNGDFMSLREHTNHVIVQGPWHILSTLTHVLNLVSEGIGNASGEDIGGISHLIRPGQIIWMQDQVVRIARLQNLGNIHAGSDASDIDADATKFNFSTGTCLPQWDAWTQGGVDRLVSCIREGMKWSSGS
ncbi:uncharacterized protein HMPREF1541_08563 [Cyphellophora europaea CBS 101466]|uniref:Uncharacterized protein n=1 Tax=Cyphellophora europaea (strain CBS 101466) TaxID=1220924 RepID=W2RII4_CYPE1|nr:uncharacterized protein HMPREF1541_08563 [Cyphellophora europaea CBS 101466]ETN36286.1 hypothetical protein HMPREF1541_08563 [Cyphellophora europaea CBS 101466]